MTSGAGRPAETTDVLVVGGGVIGASIAFHLVRLGAGEVTLVERDSLAAGATGRSGALVRTHYTNAPEARMAMAALPWFSEWDDRVGGDCGFTRTGFLQLVTPGDYGLLTQNTKMLQKVGIDTTLVDATEIKDLQPGIALDDDALGAFEPQSGYADPLATTNSLADAALRLGAKVRSGVEVQHLILDGSRVIGVHTTQGRISAGVVVLANGNWSAPLLGSIGVNVPLQAMLGQAAVVRRPEHLAGPAGHLTIIDRRHGIYLRPNRNDETLVGLSGYGESERLRSSDDVQVREGFGEQALEHLGRALPTFHQSEVLRTQCGPLDVTPDRCALVGPVSDVEDLVLAVGMSGSGFKKAPAIGACVAELVTSGAASTAPLEPFSPDRFSRGAAIARADYVVGGSEDSGRAALIH